MSIQRLLKNGVGISCAPLLRLGKEHSFKTTPLLPADATLDFES